MLQQDWIWIFSFFMHSIYIVPEDWNAESMLHFKMKTSEERCLNTDLFVGDGSLISHCSQWRCRVKNLGGTWKGLHLKEPHKPHMSLTHGGGRPVGDLCFCQRTDKSSACADDTRQLSVGGWTELPVSSGCSGSLDT